MPRPPTAGEAIPSRPPGEALLDGAARVLGALAVLVAVPACASSAAVRAAEAGNLPELRRAIAAELASGELGADDAREIARLVAEHEIHGATGPVGAEKLRGLASCVRPLDDALEDRAEVRDEPGAAAAMLRLDARLADDELEEYAALARAAEGSLAGVWRAVGARALTREEQPEDVALRRKLVGDGDERVRLGALRAALQAPDAGDSAAVLEAARLDPLPLARTLAIRVAGVHGGERTVLVLKDIWPLGDEPSRQAIADAWGTLASLDAGGRRELLWAAETQRGSPSIAAAHALVRAGGAGKSEGIGVLTRAIETGPAKDRLYAILIAPLDAPPIAAAVRKAEKDSDEAVALAAVAKRLESSTLVGGLVGGLAGGGGVTAKERAALVKRLLAAAKGATTQALSAKSALARAGAREVEPMLVKDVVDRDVRLRETAADALATLGNLPRAVSAVADDDPRVRVRVSCSILRAPEN